LPLAFILKVSKSRFGNILLANCKHIKAIDKITSFGELNPSARFASVKVIAENTI